MKCYCKWQIYIFRVILNFTDTKTFLITYFMFNTVTALPLVIFFIKLYLLAPKITIYTYLRTVLRTFAILYGFGKIAQAKKTSRLMEHILRTDCLVEQGQVSLRKGNSKFGMCEHWLLMWWGRRRTNQICFYVVGQFTDVFCSYNTQLIYSAIFFCVYECIVCE